MNNINKQQANTSILKAFAQLLFSSPDMEKVIMQPVSIKQRKLSKQPYLPFIYAMAFLVVSISAFGQTPMVRLNMSGPNNCLDETVIYYQAGATTGFDSDYDAYKLTGVNPHAIIAQQYDNTLLQINGIEEVTGSFTIPILAKTPHTGTYTIFATDFQDMPFGTYVHLYDAVTNDYVNILAGDHTFTLDDTTTAPRFFLDIDYSILPITLTTTQPHCSYNIGKCIAQTTGHGPFNYTWKDSSGNIVRTTTNTSSPDTLVVYNGGTFVVTIEDMEEGGIGMDTFMIIPSPVTPTATFNSMDTVILSEGGIFSAQNFSTNASAYLWHFSDNNSFTTSPDGHHTFTDEGLYNVTLFAYNIAGCADSVSKMITVFKVPQEPTVGMEEISAESIKWCTLGNNKFLAKNNDSENFTISMMDMNGKNMIEEKSNGEDLHFDLSNFSKGMYLMTIKTKKTSKTTKFIVD